MNPETEELIASLRQAVDDLLAENAELRRTIRDNLAIHGAQPVKRYGVYDRQYPSRWITG